MKHPFDGYRPGCRALTVKRVAPDDEPAGKINHQFSFFAFRSFALSRFTAESVQRLAETRRRGPIAVSVNPDEERIVPSLKIILVCMGSRRLQDLSRSVTRGFRQYFTVGIAAFPTESPTLLAFAWGTAATVVGLIFGVWLPCSPGSDRGQRDATDWLRRLPICSSSWPSPRCWPESLAINWPRPAAWCCPAVRASVPGIAIT